MEELYDAYCIQRRLRDGASKMVAAFNSATGSREARESLSEANKGYKECTEVSEDGRSHLERLVCRNIMLGRFPVRVCSTCAHWRANLKVKWENFMSR